MKISCFALIVGLIMGGISGVAVTVALELQLSKLATGVSIATAITFGLLALYFIIFAAVNDALK